MMSTATIEEFQKNAATLLAEVERGEHIIIERGQKPVARLLPMVKRKMKGFVAGTSQSRMKFYGNRPLPDTPTAG